MKTKSAFLTSRILGSSLLGMSILVSAAFAGDRSNVRGTSMARTYIVLSRSVDCLGINPANLGLDDRLPFTLALPSVGGRISSDLLNLDTYNKYFSGIPDPQNPGNKIGYLLTDQDKNEILSLIPADGATRADVEANLFGLSIQMGRRYGAYGDETEPSAGICEDVPVRF
jgi:hypothetical protein